MRRNGNRFIKNLLSWNNLALVNDICMRVYDTLQKLPTSHLLAKAWQRTPISWDNSGWERDQQCGMRLTESWQLTKWSKKVTMKMEYFSWGWLLVPCDFFALESLQLQCFLIPVFFYISDWLHQHLHGAWNLCENQLPKWQ